MITRLKMANFRSLSSNVELPLGRFNVLVGVNGSGKSNILRALSFVREATRIGLPGAVTNSSGIGSIRRLSTGHPRNVKIDLELSLNGCPARYWFELTGDRSEEYRVKEEGAQVSDAKGQVTSYRTCDGTFEGPENLRPNLDRQSLALTAIGGDARFRPLWEYLANMMVYSINPAVLRAPQKFTSEGHLSAQGENWVSILHTQEGASWNREMLVALEKLTGDIDDVRVTQAAGYLVAEFHHKTSNDRAQQWFPAERESDGTLRVAGQLTAMLQEPPLPLLAIEEPEQTVHPGAIPLLYDYLKEASTRSQIIVTTHSPSLLDYLDLEVVKVFIVERQEAGTRVALLAEEDKRAVIDKLLTLGDLMVARHFQLSLPFADED